MKGLSVRRTNDLDLVRILHDELIGKDCWCGDDQIFWLATYDDIPVGFCAVKKLTGANAGGAFLSRAGVLKSARGKGVQKKLITARTSWAKRQGLTYAITYVAKGNWPSLTNLIRCGFHVYRPKWAYVGRKDYLYLQKVL